MQPAQYIAYYRVSTSRQGTSGLGLEAQREAVTNYLKPLGTKPIAEFIEVESGRKTDRPQMQAALQMASARKATLIIAKLDRLARSVSFISSLMDGRVPFICADMPDANRMTLQISAVFAEHEAKMISERTKAALAAAKARGVKLGGMRKPDEANTHAESIRPFIQSLNGAGITTPAAIARELNHRGYTTLRGRVWHSNQVTRLLERLAAG